MLLCETENDNATAAPRASISTRGLLLSSGAATNCKDAGLMSPCRLQQELAAGILQSAAHQSTLKVMCISRRGFAGDRMLCLPCTRREHHVMRDVGRAKATSA